MSEVLVESLVGTVVTVPCSGIVRVELADGRFVFLVPGTYDAGTRGDHGFRIGDQVTVRFQNDSGTLTCLIARFLSPASDEPLQLVVSQEPSFFSHSIMAHGDLSDSVIESIRNVLMELCASGSPVEVSRLCPDCVLFRFFVRSSIGSGSFSANSYGQKIAEEFPDVYKVQIFQNLDVFCCRLKRPGDA